MWIGSEEEQQREKGILIDSVQDATEGITYVRCTAAGQTDVLKEAMVNKSELLKGLLETDGEACVPMSAGHFQCWRAAAQRDIASPALQALANAAQVLL